MLAADNLTKMNKINKVIFLCVLIVNTFSAASATSQRKSFKLKLSSAHISPEILNELKDFKDLIPSATVDEIFAKHYVVDGSFRTAVKYLRSEEFRLLQKQLLMVPEIIEVLEFLHLTTANATTRHDKIRAATNARNSPAEIVNIENANGKQNNLRVPKMAQEQQQQQQRPQFHMHEAHNKYGHDDDDDDANAYPFASNEEQSLVHIVLLEDIRIDEQGYHLQHHHKHNRPHYYRYQLHTSLGTLTTFVEEVLQHLPNAAYQNMIKDKCSKNPKFSDFYHALRNADLKPLIDHIKMTSNIRPIIATLNSHDVDAESLEPIAFKVISWGPEL